MRTERAIIIIRLMVGLVFLSEGIQKFLFADTLGAGRFLKIGIPMPDIMGPFVGAVEITAGSLLILGLFTRLAVIPLLCVMFVAIVTTKFPQLMSQGFWPTAHDGRTDFLMIMSLIFLLNAGAGPISLDQRVRKRN
jgi:putative oxidoreductase